MCEDVVRMKQSQGECGDNLSKPFMTLMRIFYKVCNDRGKKNA